MSTMFSKFSKFRSRDHSSRHVTPQRDHHNNHDDNQKGNFSPSYDKPLPSGKHGVKPTSGPAPVKPLYAVYDTDTEDNVSFAESLFPISPPSEVRLRSSESFESDNDDSFSPDVDSQGNYKQFPSLQHDLRKQAEGVVTPRGGGKRSSDTSSKRSGQTRSWTSSSLPEEEEIDIGPPVLPPYEDAEEVFLEEFEDYFNNLQVDNVRRDQYPNLDLQKLVYLDYASFSLYSRFQVEEHFKILLAEGPCLGSASVSSSSLSLDNNPMSMHISHTQQRLLRMLNTTPLQYSIIFTSGFQESFRVLAESFPFQKGSPLLVCQDNHAAVRQVIQAAYRAGGKPVLAPVTEKELCFPSHDLHKLLRRQAGRNISNGGLFVYPAQSNLSGIRHSLGWLVEAQQSGWDVCIDATTLLPSSTIDLHIHQPDFVVGSFHHMVGYPSGLGFLLVRRESFCVQAAPELQFVRNQSPDLGEDCHVVCPVDNTMNLLQFAALNLGLVQLERIGLRAIQQRVHALVQWLVQRLCSLRHKDDDSRYLVRVYGSHVAKDRGSIVSFNVMDYSGTVLPPGIVRKLAVRCNIKLSVGNFNNPGLANILLGGGGVDVGVVQENWGFMAVRASLGPVSSFSDVYRLVQFLARFRDEEYLTTEAMGFVEERNFMLQ